MYLIASTSAPLFTELISQHICIHVTMPTSEMRRTTTSLSTPLWEFLIEILKSEDEYHRIVAFYSLMGVSYPKPVSTVSRVEEVRNFLLPYGSFLIYTRFND